MTQDKPASSTLWPMVIVCLILMAGVLLRPRGAAAPHTPQPLPPITAAGWLNTDQPPELSGKVVVLDAWFTKCGYCILAMPDLAKVRQEWSHDPRVQFIGVTPEGDAMRDDIQGVINGIDGFDWPVAYGANATLDMLEVQAYPTLFVFDETGTSVWRGHSVEELRAALEGLL